eukprot:TRINITY_DN4643_c0_g2_i1.p1 TRINITY_DN4643_c0_g2~~TRINITY_DN4643_c0_g2_i1.p1  ORF type:complete len:509 (-),score=54.13 TRINITY_DN4643_c0_g2_i1:1998-3524(-)
MDKAAKIFCLCLLSFICASLADQNQDTITLAVDLVNTTFHKEVGNVPSNYAVLMEFYASWCPACRHFKPAFEKIANYFNQEPRVQPEVWVARIDCAVEHDLCRSYEVKSYPTLYLGYPEDFKTDSVSKLTQYKGAKSPSVIVQWIANYTKGVYDFQDEEHHTTEEELQKVAKKQALPQATEESVEDIEKATVIAFEEIVESDLEGKRLAVIEIFTLLSTAHPSKRCQQGFQTLVDNFNKYWKPDLGSPEKELKAYKVCGEDVVIADWKSCKGSREDTRGYTCGLWNLFHSLSTRVEEQLGGLTWLRGVEAYVRYFFACSTCQKHFMQMITSKEAQQISSRRDAVMWMWMAHNKVNKRLVEEEKKEGTGDPQYPKVQWPPLSLCLDCYETNNQQDPQWSYPHVYQFLMHYYGNIEVDLEPESNFRINQFAAILNFEENQEEEELDVVGQPSVQAPSGKVQFKPVEGIQSSDQTSIVYPLLVISGVLISLIYCMRRDRSASTKDVFDRNL